MLLLNINGKDRLLLPSDKSGEVRIVWKKEFQQSMVPSILEEYDALTGELVVIKITEDEDTFRINIPKFGVDSVIGKKGFKAEQDCYKNAAKLETYRHIRFIEFLELNDFRI